MLGTVKVVATQAPAETEMHHRSVDVDRAEVAAIAENCDPASFDNTVLALEKSGRLLTRIEGVTGVHSSFVLRKVVDKTALPVIKV